MKKSVFILLMLIAFAPCQASGAEQFKVLHQVTGPIETNCYLIYDLKSREAALVDPGGPVATLTDFIKAKRLKLKYIFITHQHIDHTIGVPDIRSMFPKAKLCMHKDEYRDFFTQKEWAIKNYGPEWFAEGSKNPEIAKFFEFDVKLLKKPEIFVEDNQTFKLGSLKIKAIICPGHSPAGTCYAAGNVLFSGDVLFYRSVGRIDTQNGSREAQIQSVRKLYSIFPDSTVVYPGHGQFTDIGSEKRENKRITLDGGEWCAPTPAKPIEAVPALETWLKNGAYDEQAARAFGADEYGMRKYVIAFLKSGPNRPADTKKREELQAAHLQNIDRMAVAGKLVLAGPFLDDGDLRGIYVFNVATVAEAEQLTRSDPAIQAGSLVMELKEWYGSAALMAVNDIHSKLAKRPIAGENK